jgi:hypothetical protein
MRTLFLVLLAFAIGWMLGSVFTHTAVAPTESSSSRMSAPNPKRQDMFDTNEPVVSNAAKILDTALLFFEPGHLDSIAQKYKNEWASATPFSHVVIDNFLPSQIVAAVVDDWEGPSGLEMKIEKDKAPSFFKGGAVDPEQAAVGPPCTVDPPWSCRADFEQWNKATNKEEASFGGSIRLCSLLMKSQPFTTFLEKLTGIDDLIPDPQFRGVSVLTSFLH